MHLPITENGSKVMANAAILGEKAESQRHGYSTPGRNRIQSVINKAKE